MAPIRIRGTQRHTRGFSFASQVLEYNFQARIDRSTVKARNHQIAYNVYDYDLNVHEHRESRESIEWTAGNLAPLLVDPSER